MGLKIRKAGVFLLVKDTNKCPVAYFALTSKLIEEHQQGIKGIV